MLKKDPYEGHLFAFVGKSNDKVKRRQVEMEAGQLAMLLDGIDLNARRLAGPARWPSSVELRARVAGVVC